MNSTELIQKAKDSFKTLAKKGYEWRSFYNGYLIGYSNAKAEFKSKEQQTKSLQEFNNHLLDLYADRDSYSRGKLLDLVKDKVEELFGGE